MKCKKHLSDATSAIGVCSSCLRDRLLSLMAAQARAELQAQQHKSDVHLLFPRSVSPYVSSPWENRHSRFYTTPQVRETPLYNATSTSTSFVSTASVSSVKHRSKFSLWSSLFRSRSDQLDSVPTDSSSSSSSSSWISSIFSRRNTKKQSKHCSIEGCVDRRDCDGGSPWKASPAISRRGRQGLNRSVSGVALCLSPLVSVSPNRNWNQKGFPASEFTYSGEIRVPTKPHLSAAASFCANRSRKLADFGRLNANP